MKFIPNTELLRSNRSKRYYALLASVLSLTVLAPLIDSNMAGRFIIGVLAVLSLVTAVLAANAGKKASSLAIILAICTLFFWVLSLNSGALSAYSIHTLTIGYVVILVFAVTIAWLMMKDIFNNEVNGNRVAGAICVYLLVGFFFAIVHSLILLYNPDAYKDSSGDLISYPQGAMSAHRIYPLFVYFSFCTLSTAGYGDVVPVSRTARTASWLEAVAGQVYLTVLVARLVGLHIASANPGSTADKKSNADAIKLAEVSAPPPSPSAE